jgi:transcriptional regulator with XRE-family HTH domain
MQVAERAGLDRSFISDLERGIKDGTGTTLATLAVAFSMTLSELLEGV